MGNTSHHSEGHRREGGQTVSEETASAGAESAKAADSEIQSADASQAAECQPEGAAEVERLTAALNEKTREAAEFKDKYLRALAETENVRKRIRQQGEETVRFQRESLLRELLSIVDNLERAVEAARGGGNGKSIVEGVELVLASLLGFLKEQGVTPQSAVGQPFDPARHEAIGQVASDTHAPNTVVEEAHRGYQIGDRVLRPARVVVAKPPEQAAPSGERKNGENNS